MMFNVCRHFSTISYLSHYTKYDFQFKINWAPLVSARLRKWIMILISFQPEIIINIIINIIIIKQFKINSQGASYVYTPS